MDSIIICPTCGVESVAPDQDQCLSCKAEEIALTDCHSFYNDLGELNREIDDIVHDLTIRPDPLFDPLIDDDEDLWDDI